MKNFFRKFLFFFLILGVSCNEEGDFELTVLHTNDIHAHIEETNQYGGTCEEGVACFGGVARKHTVVQQIRNTSKNVILVDGGDEFTGTLWFNTYKGLAAVTFMNYTKYDAMSVGNHEFDNGDQNLIEFIKLANFPVLAANLNVSAVPDWPNPPLFLKSTILERSGRKIGVIGYITEDTKWLSSPSKNVVFTDVIESVRAEAQRLTAMGVNIILALGHAGYEYDQKLGKEVKELDLVIGGHTHTFLYNGPQPSNDKIQGPYPTVVTRDDGSKVPVVQDFTYAKYLGNLKITFDSEGNVNSWSGNPIVLNESYPQDPIVLKKVEKMAEPIMNQREEGIGRTLVFLEGDRSICRLKECNLGNMVADAIVHMQLQNPNEAMWATVVLGFWNGGGIRSGNIDKSVDEMLTSEDLTNVLPFGNTADIIQIKGGYLLEAFEHGFSGLETGEGRYPQVSGFKVYYDLTKPVGSRLVAAYALCQQCRVPSYEKIKPEVDYLVVTSGYLSDGGDGYESLTHYTLKTKGPTALYLLQQYVEARSPVYPGDEGRTLDISNVNLDFLECDTRFKYLKKGLSFLDHIKNAFSGIGNFFGKKK